MTPAPTTEARSIAEALYMQAIDLVAEGNSVAAVGVFQECLAVDPTFLDAMHGLIRALQNSNRLDEAVIIAQHLISLDPEDALPHTSLSILYQHKGLIAEAEAEATKARVLDWKQQLRHGIKPNTDL